MLEGEAASATPMPSRPFFQPSPFVASGALSLMRDRWDGRPDYAHELWLEGWALVMPPPWTQMSTSHSQPLSPHQALPFRPVDDY